MDSKVFYVLTRDTQPGTRVWCPGDLEEFKSCPKCEDKRVWHQGGFWKFNDGTVIAFCPFCGYDLSKAVYKVQGILKEWTGPQDLISPHKWAVVTMEDGTERTVATNRRGNGNINQGPDS